MVFVVLFAVVFGMALVWLGVEYSDFLTVSAGVLCLALGCWLFAGSVDWDDVFPVGVPVVVDG